MLHLVKNLSLSDGYPLWFCLRREITLAKHGRVGPAAFIWALSARMGGRFYLFLPARRQVLPVFCRHLDSLISPQEVRHKMKVGRREYIALIRVEIRKSFTYVYQREKTTVVVWNLLLMTPMRIRWHSETKLNKCLLPGDAVSTWMFSFSAVLPPPPTQHLSPKVAPIIISSHKDRIQL